MRKLVSVKADSTLDISVEERLFKNIHKAHAWYTNSKLSKIAILACAGTDLAGFLQIMHLTISEDFISRSVITAALVIAFEVAPLYIGYAICLKAYGFGKRIRNWILVFSCCACILGIMGNTYFRFGTMDFAYAESETYKIRLPITVLMCLLPIITSLVNLVIGCLAFDPMQLELLRLSKKLAKLKLRRQQIKAYLEELNDEGKLQQATELEEEDCYKKIRNDIQALQTRLKTYVVVRTSGLYTIKHNK